MKKTALASAIFAAALTACTGSGVTDPDSADSSTTTASIGIDSEATAAAISELRAELAAFGTEVQAAASVELEQAWANLDSELAALANSAQQGNIGELDLAPARDALEEVSVAVQADQDDLSEAFQEFWTGFTARFNAAVNS